MIAHRRADVADLNARARERLRAAGLLGPELETPAGSFAVGDHVVVKRNDAGASINNGDRGRVTARRPDTRRDRDRAPRSPVRARPPTSSPSRPPPATRRSCTATRSPATSPKA